MASDCLHTYDPFFEGSTVRELDGYHLFHVYCVIETTVKNNNDDVLCEFLPKFSDHLLDLYSKIIAVEEMNQNNSNFNIDQKLVPILKGFLVSKRLKELEFKNIFAILVQIYNKSNGVETLCDELQSVLVSRSLSKPRLQKIIGFLPILFENYSNLMEKLIAHLFFTKRTIELISGLDSDFNIWYNPKVQSLKCYFINYNPKSFKITNDENMESKLKLNMYFVDYFAKFGETEKAKDFLNNVIVWINSNGEIVTNNEKIISNLISIETLKSKILFNTFMLIDFNKFSADFDFEIALKIYRSYLKIEKLTDFLISIENKETLNDVFTRLVPKIDGLRVSVRKYIYKIKKHFEILGYIPDQTIYKC